MPHFGSSGSNNLPGSNMSLAGDFGTLDGQVDGTDFDPYLLSDPWSDNMSWPWLHETLFLQNYPDLGTPGVLANVPSVGDTTSLNNHVWDSEVFPSANAISTWPVPNAQNHPQALNVTTNTNNALQQNQFLSNSNQEPFLINGRPFLSPVPEVHPDSYVRKESGEVKLYQAPQPIAPAAQPQPQPSKPVVTSDSSKQKHDVRMS